MASGSYQARRGQIETYFDRTAAETWARLTSSAPVGGIRATVRAGRDQMRQTLLDWLPADLTGRRVFDAGCGTGLFAVEAARRGAEVLAVDIAPTLVELARERLPAELAPEPATGGGPGRVTFKVGDLVDPGFGDFDHVVAMDSLIHYRTEDAVELLARLAERTRTSILFTFAPRTALLATMHTVGRLFPKRSRAPSIEPVAEAKLTACLAADPVLAGWPPARTERVINGFYTSQAMELRPA